MSIGTHELERDAFALQMSSGGIHDVVDRAAEQIAAARAVVSSLLDNMPSVAAGSISFNQVNHFGHLVSAAGICIDAAAKNLYELEHHLKNR